MPVHAGLAKAAYLSSAGLAQAALCHVPAEFRGTRCRVPLAHLDSATSSATDKWTPETEPLVATKVWVVLPTAQRTLAQHLAAREYERLLAKGDTARRAALHSASCTATSAGPEAKPRCLMLTLHAAAFAAAMCCPACHGIP
jgi:hypothetical protein